MKEEYKLLIENRTWELCLPPKDKKILRSKWIYKVTENAKGKIQRYKVRLVVKDYKQIQGIDYNEVFCPVVRFNTLRCLFTLAAKHDYDIDHLNVITAFFNGNLKEKIYMQQHEGFVKKGEEGKVCKLKKALYGLKQRANACMEQEVGSKFIHPKRD